MFKHILKNSFLVVLIVIFMIIEPTINSGLNYWLQDLFNVAEIGTPSLLIIRLLLLGFMIWILKRIIVYVSNVIQAYIVCKVKRDVKHNIFYRLFKLDANKLFKREDSGRFLSFFTNDINILEQKYLNSIFDLISGLFSLVILGASFLTLNWKIGVFIIAFGLISMLVPFLFTKHLNNKNYMYSQEMSRFTLRLKEYLSAYPTIKNYSIESQIDGRFDNINDRTEETKFDYESSLALSNNIGSMLSWFMQFMAVGIGLMLVINGEILIGTVIAARSFASDLAMPLQMIIANLNSIKSVKSVVARIEEIASDVNENTSNIVIENKNGILVEYKNLSVNIEGQKILDDISFTFEKGKKYLVIGRNGCGKSTMFKTLKKRINNFTGDILINGISFKDISNEELSKKVSYLNENVSLFSGKVKDNITLFRDVDKKSYENAIKNAQINIDVERNIIDGGVNVSSGEQRRIEIARCLIDSVDCIVFDEVISTLDIETAYEIEKMILSYTNKTIIFISHNFSGLLMECYDEIIYMDKGKIIAHGPMKEIIKNEQFKNILKIKLGDVI